jgi:hypothetical protein
MGAIAVVYFFRCGVAGRSGLLIFSLWCGGAIAVVYFFVVVWGAIAVVYFFVVAWREGEASGRGFSVFPGGLLPDASPLRCVGIYDAWLLTLLIRIKKRLKSLSYYLDLEEPYSVP